MAFFTGMYDLCIQVNASSIILQIPLQDHHSKTLANSTNNVPTQKEIC